MNQVCESKRQQWQQLKANLLAEYADNMRKQEELTKANDGLSHRILELDGAIEAAGIIEKELDALPADVPTDASV